MQTAELIIQTLLFGYVASFNLERVDYALLDMSHSHYSEELAAHLDGSGIFRRVATLGNTGQMAQFIENGEVSGVVVIPADFADKLVQGQTAPVQVITDGRNTVISSLVQWRFFLPHTITKRNGNISLPWIPSPGITRIRLPGGTFCHPSFRLSA